MICEKYSSCICIILVLKKTNCLVRQIKTGMPRLTIINHSELYPEVLNSLNKNASNEMSEYLHDKIRKHATKQGFEIPKRWHCTTGFLPNYRSSRLNTRSVRKVKVYMTDFFLFARLNLPNVLISVAKKFFP